MVFTRKGLVNQFILVFILVFFIEKINNLINEYLITDFLENIRPNLLKDIFIIALFSIAVYYLTKNTIKRKLFLNWNFIITTISILIIYLTYRIYEIFPLTTFSFCYGIKYSDAFFIITVYLISSIYNSTKPKLNQSINNVESFIQDIPDTFNGQDLLHRSKIITQITTRIINTTPYKSFAIGILGKWGSGKTFFLNAIESSIKSINPKDYIIIKFNPWLNNGKDKIVEDFFHAFEEAIGEYDPKLSMIISSYSKKITEAESNLITRIFEMFIHLFIKDKNVFEQHKQIENEILGLRKKIIVFIDDIDRLSEEEIIETFKIIRNTANFPNVFFIVAYDNTYIHSILDKSNFNDGQNYLEKIFQLEIPLPYFQKSIIISTLIQLLSKDKNENDKLKLNIAIDELRNANFQGSSNDFISEYITNFRDVIRFVNSVNILFEMIKNDIEIIEYLHLELIKLKHKDIYHLIGTQKIIIVNRNDSGETSFYFDATFFNTYLLHEEISMTKNCVFKLSLSLQYIFRIKQHKPARTITDPSNILIYFNPQLFDQISISELKTLKLGERLTFFGRLDEWILGPEKNDLLKILIETTSYDSKEDFEASIEAMFYLSKYDIEGWHQHIFSLLMQNNKILDLYYPENEIDYKKLIKRQLSSGHFPYLFHSTLTHDILYQSINKTYLEHSFSLSIKELKDILFNYLNRYLNSNSNMDRNSLILYRNNYSHTNEPDKLIIIDSKANALMYDRIKSNPFDFLKYAIVKNEDDKFKLFPFIPQIFKSGKEFKNYISKLSDYPASFAIKTFLKQFELNNFKPINYSGNEYFIIPSDDTTTYIESSERRKTVEFMHHGFGDNFYEIYPEFIHSKWIAHQYPISDNEASNGGIYKFEKHFYIDNNFHKSITKVSISFIVDDDITIIINGTVKREKIRTGKDRVTIEISQRELVFPQNTIEFIVRNDTPKKKTTANDNPYGFIYAIRIEHDYELFDVNN